MKSFFLLTSFLLTTAACQQPSSATEDRLLMEAHKVIGFDNTVRRSLSDVWINTASFCTGSPGTNIACAEQLDALQRQLNSLNPIPVPQPGAALPMTSADATVLYRRFVRDHQGEPILAVFQQSYPRILLNKYGLIAGTEYNLIAYYAQQLTASNALDFETRTQALTVLTGHLPARLYDQLLTQTIWAAQQEQVRQRAEVKRLRQVMASHRGPASPKDPTTYRSGMYKHIIEQYQASTLADDVTRLLQLQLAGAPPLPQRQRT